MDEFENTPEFQALVVSATTRPERRMGESVIPAEAPQWKEVRTLARALLETNSEQLPVHVYLAQAEASVNGFPGFLNTLRTIEYLLSERWDELQPAADVEDPDDMYYGRVNLINELSHQPDFLDVIYRIPLVTVKSIGTFSTRDLDISSGVVVGTSEDQIRCQDGLIKGAFAESDPVELANVADTLGTLPALCRSLEKAFAEKTQQTGIISLESLINRLEHCRQRFLDFATQYLPADPVGEELVTVDSANRRVASGQPASSIRNSAMAADSFNAVLLYYQKYEPSSPVRVLTATAREFINRSFFEVLQAMAPDRRDNLPLLLQQLSDQPLSSLLSDSYARYLAGENLPTLDEVISSAPVALAANQASSPVESLCGPMPYSTFLNGHTKASAASTQSENHSALCENSPRQPISSRQQVLETLDDIEIYFNVAEPSSPIPVIVSDIKKLVSKSFMDLLEDFSRKLPATEPEKG